MDQGKFRKLNRVHVVFLVQNVMISYGLFSFPYMTSNLGNFSWVSPIILGILITIILYPMVKICERYPTDSLFVINEKVLSKPIGKGINLLIIVYGVLIVSNITTEYLRLVQVVSLPTKSLTMSALIFYIILLTIVLGGIKLIARFSTFSFFMTAWMVYFLLWPLSKGMWLSAFSNFTYSIDVWLTSFHQGAKGMLGFELILFYYPYIINKKKAYKDAVTGVWVAIFFYFAVTFSSVVYFSIWQLQNVRYPVLNFYKAVQFSFLDRIENFGLSLWVFLVLSTCAAYLWVAKRGLDALLSKNQNRNWHLYFLASLSLFFYLGPIPLWLQEFVFDHVLIYIAYAVLALPLFLLIVSYIRGLKGEKQC